MSCAQLSSQVSALSPDITKYFSPIPCSPPDECGTNYPTPFWQKIKHIDQLVWPAFDRSGPSQAPSVQGQTRNKLLLVPQVASDSYQNVLPGRCLDCVAIPYSGGASKNAGSWARYTNVITLSMFPNPKPGELLHETNPCQMLHRPRSARLLDWPVDVVKP